MGVIPDFKNTAKRWRIKGTEVGVIFYPQVSLLFYFIFFSSTSHRTPSKFLHRFPLCECTRRKINQLFSYNLCTQNSTVASILRLTSLSKTLSLVLKQLRNGINRILRNEVDNSNTCREEFPFYPTLLTTVSFPLLL